MFYFGIDLLHIGGFQGAVIGYDVLFGEVHRLSVIGFIVLPCEGIIVAIAVGIIILGRHGIAVAVHPDDATVFITVQALQVGF